MRYILDNLGYIEEVSSGHTMTCNNKSCTEYTGTIPEGYESLEEWAINSNIRAYKIVDGNLTYDAERDELLKSQYTTENQNEIRITSTNTPPDNTGTWELIDKEFKSQYIYTEDTKYITRTNVSSADARIVISGHSIVIDTKFVLKTDLTDTTVNILTLNLNSFIDTFRNQRYSSGFSDGGACMLMLALTTAGVLQCVDIVGDSVVTSGQTCYANLNITMAAENMLDSACDKFYWKRKE